MIELIGQNHVVGASDDWQQRRVGLPAAWEQQRGLLAQPAGAGALGGLVRRQIAAQQPRSAGAGAEFLQRRARRRNDARIPRHPQIITAGEVHARRPGQFTAQSCGLPGGQLGSELVRERITQCESVAGAGTGSSPSTVAQVARNSRME